MIHYIKGVFKGAYYSSLGLRYAASQERAFKTELFLSIFIIPAAFYFGDGFLEQSILFMSWFLVPIVELLNSAVEAVVDRIGTEYNELSGRAKDLASAGVFLCVVLFLIIWGMKLFYYFSA